MTAEEFDDWAAAEADAVESALHAWVPQDAPAGRPTSITSVTTPTSNDEPATRS